MLWSWNTFERFLFDINGEDSVDLVGILFTIEYEEIL